MAKTDTIRTVKTCQRLEGEVVPPGDKSISHRAAILNSLATGEAKIDDFAPGADCLSTVRCLKALGVKISRRGSRDSLTLLVSGTGEDGLKEASNVLDARNS
ncbi:MAG TPA: 3-phosphoshikimate 1-carboxyvinyltransferase, partial [Dehalococcoidia bacterium]|nr:3-phosphoshikimate 1-carboxyvinyltransferase [Dehalococcoidia bacterium]